MMFPVSPGVQQIEPYKSPHREEEFYGIAGRSVPLRMASNENCLGPSPHVMDAMRNSLDSVNRYPHPDGYPLRKALAEKLGISENRIILGHGSTELIEILARTYLSAGTDCITAEQTFPIYRIATTYCGASCVETPLNNWTYDLEAIQNCISADTRMIFIANPNNPTGTMVSRAKFEKFLQSIPANILVVLDEAYCEYVQRDDYPDGAQFLDPYPNVVILRTFSKIHSLAGLRIGYGLAREEIVDSMNRVRSPYNTSIMAGVAARAALEDSEHVEASRTLNAEERRFLERELTALNIPFVPSVANFLLLLVDHPHQVQTQLLHRGILVSSMQWFRVPNGLRVTIGTHEENKTFIAALHQVKSKK